jgi:hypothetical protein
MQYDGLKASAPDALTETSDVFVCSMTVHESDNHNFAIASFRQKIPQPSGLALLGHHCGSRVHKFRNKCTVLAIVAYVRGKPTEANAAYKDDSE